MRGTNVGKPLQRGVIYNSSAYNGAGEEKKKIHQLQRVNLISFQLERAFFIFFLRRARRIYLHGNNATKIGAGTFAFFSFLAFNNSLLISLNLCRVT